MELTTLVEAEGLSKFAARVGVSKSYLCHVLKDRKPFGRKLAIRIYRATGHKLGPVAEASDEEIDTLERFQSAA